MTKYCQGTGAGESRKDQSKLKGSYTWLQCADTLAPTQIRPAISEPIHDVAVTFLLNRYIQGSRFEYLPCLYHVCDATSALPSTLKAVGLASLSLYTSQPELKGRALKFYGEAIAEVNYALQSREAAQRDDVLASIMLLSLYEALTLRQTTDTEAWSTHVHGALSLVALRGQEQFQSKIGLELFKQTATGIKLFCIQHCIRIPIQLREMLEFVACHSKTTDAEFFRPPITEAFTDLRADIAEGLLSEPDDIVAGCEVVLKLAEDFLLGLLPCEQYDRVVVGPPLMNGRQNFYLKFRNHHVAQMWNTTWMAKLALNTMIYEQELRVSHQSATPTSPATKTLRALRAQEEVTQAAENICATIPEYFLADTSQQVSEKPRATVSMGYSLIWPLFTVGSNPLVTATTRDYVVSKLGYIAREFKLPQAQWAGEMLVGGVSGESWMHMYHAF